MSADEQAGEVDRELDWLLLRPEVRETLASRGYRLEVNVCGPDGSVPSFDELAELREQVDAAERASQAARRLAILGELCAGVTHEARNLMTGVLGFAQIAIERAGDAKLVASTLRPCEQAARSCVELLTNYLVLARGYSRPAQLLSVEDVIVPAARLVARQLEARKCTLHVIIPRPAPAVVGRRGDLQQVVLNLVLNAMQALGEGGTITVEAAAAPEARTLVTVQDDGPGVEESIRERIFQPLFTTKPEGEGTGLGLALSRDIVEAHGGTLTLDASAAHGARFVISLPADGFIDRGLGTG